MIVETHIVFEAGGRLFESRHDAMRYVHGASRIIKRRTVVRATGRRYWKPLPPVKKKAKA